jgi:hypothetical protein
VHAAGVLEGGARRDGGGTVAGERVGVARDPGAGVVKMSFPVPGSCTATRGSGVLALRYGHYSGLQRRGSESVAWRCDYVDQSPHRGALVTQTPELQYNSRGD